LQHYEADRGAHARAQLSRHSIRRAAACQGREGEPASFSEFESGNGHSRNGKRLGFCCANRRRHC